MKGLFERGTLVQVQAGYWSMEATLSAGDLDKQRSEIPEFVRLGYKRLFPKEVRNRFASRVGRARNLCNRYGFDFFLTGAYFVPLKALETLLPEVEAAQLEFAAETERFLTDYEKLREDYLEVYPQHRDKLEEFYPPVEQLRSKFYFNAWCYSVTSPAIPVGEFSTLEEDQYVGWATGAVNELRTEAREVAAKIKVAIEEDSLDGRTLRRVGTLVERLSNLDLMEDPKLLQAAKALQQGPDIGATENLKKAAKTVSNVRIRKLLLD